MSRVSEMLLSLEPRRPMCSVCKERLHILRKVPEEKAVGVGTPPGEMVFYYYCLECFPEEAQKMLESYKRLEDLCGGISESPC